MDEWKYTTILYEGLVMDGTLLPPVIFTNCPDVPANIEENRIAFVIYIENLQAPSAALTLRWIDTIQAYIDDSPLIIHDRGPEYMAQSVQEELEQLEVDTKILPATGGAFANPCDNAFNSAFRRLYSENLPSSYFEKLVHIIDCYYAAQESSISRYFRHIGYCGPRPSKKRVARLLNEGFKPGRQNAELYGKMKNSYLAWRRGLRMVESSNVNIVEGSHEEEKWQKIKRE